MVELRQGRWQEVLDDVDEVDCLITDPPYTVSTANGQRGCRTSSWLGSTSHSGITYGHITRDEVREVVRSWAPRVRRWWVFFGDHLSAEWWREDLSWFDQYAFPPVIWVKTDAAPRIMADGPSPQHETIAIARPRRRLERVEKRYRPGWYRGPGARKGCTADGARLIGQKPLWLMRALIRDYSEPGDLICDPFAGMATTLIAAAIEGRRSIGAEVDPETHEVAQRRIARGYTPDLFVEAEAL